VIDAHAHLTDRRFADDLDAVLERARSSGVQRVLTAAEDLRSSEDAIAVAAAHREVRVAVGVHPHRAATWSDAAAGRLRELTRAEAVVAIGEIGMDFSGRSAPPDVQERALRGQIALAARLGLPIVLHVRESGARVREILRESPAGESAGDGSPVRGMVHCYSEGPAELEDWLRLGFLVSFAGTLTYPGSDRLREAAAGVPADRLLAETDAPYLAPQHVRGRRNEPLYVAAVHATLAHLRQADFAELVRDLAANARFLFGKRWGT